MVVLQTFVSGVYMVMLPTLAIGLLDLGDSGLGLLSSAMGVGGVIGALATTGLVGSRRLGLALAAGCVLWGAPLILVGVAPGLGVAIVALGVVGLGNTFVDVSAFTLLQRAAPEELLGRVFGVLEGGILLSIALGAVVAPALVALLGDAGALAATGVVLPVAVMLRLRPIRRVDAATAPAVDETALALLGGVEMLAALPAPVVERLARALVAAPVAAGETVFAQGDRGDRFYIVEDGRLEVLVDDRRVRELGAGAAFGEIALLRDVPRTATVTASMRSRLYELDRDTFQLVVSAHPRSRDSVHATADSRLAAVPTM
jgi:MFS family permease